MSDCKNEKVESVCGCAGVVRDRRAFTVVAMEREVVPGQFYFLGPKLQQCLNIKGKLAHVVVYLLKMLHVMGDSIRKRKEARVIEGVA